MTPTSADATLIPQLYSPMERAVRAALADAVWPVKEVEE